MSQNERDSVNKTVENKNETNGKRWTGDLVYWL